MEAHVFHSLEETLLYLSTYEMETNSKFCSIKATKGFGKGDLTKIKRVFFKDKKSIVHGRQEFTGSPFAVIGNKNLACQYGKNRKKPKKKYDDEADEHNYAREKQLYAQRSKKVDCPAEIIMRELVRFPTFCCLADSSTREGKNKQHAISKEIYHRLSTGDITTKIEYVLCLPDIKKHCGHAVRAVNFSHTVAGATKGDQKQSPEKTSINTSTSDSAVNMRHWDQSVSPEKASMGMDECDAMVSWPSLKMEHNIPRMQSDKEIEEDGVFGKVSAVIKNSEKLSDEEFSEIAEKASVTVICLDDNQFAFQGSWKAVNRAHKLLETVRQQNGDDMNTWPNGVTHFDDTLETIISEVRSSHTEIARQDLKASSFEPLETRKPAREKRIPQISKSPQRKMPKLRSDYGNVCGICYKTFTTQKYARVHMKIHFNERNYECSTCGFKCRNSHGLKKHMEIHKPIEQRKFPFECENCGHKFSKKGNYLVHLKNHSGRFSVACDVPGCNATFRHRLGLARHKIIHAKKNAFVCQTCQSTFPSRADLVNHMTTHTEGKHSHSLNYQVVKTENSIKSDIEKTHVDTTSEVAQSVINLNLSVLNQQLQNLPDNSSIQIDLTDENRAVLPDAPGTVYMCGLCEQNFSSFELAEKHSNICTGVP